MKVKFKTSSETKMESRFTAVFEKRGRLWIGWVEEISGVNTQGRTLKEARENLKEALKLVIEANRELSRKQYQNKQTRREEIKVRI